MAAPSVQASIGGADSIAVYGGEGLADNAARTKRGGEPSGTENAEELWQTAKRGLIYVFCGQHPAIGDAAQSQPLPV